jgi:hypothetical protein
MASIIDKLRYLAMALLGSGEIGRNDRIQVPWPSPFRIWRTRGCSILKPRVDPKSNI